jgi:hypothetical protein
MILAGNKCDLEEKRAVTRHGGTPAISPPYRSLISICWANQMAAYRGRGSGTAHRLQIYGDLSENKHQRR